jgi:hypothetical protein
LGCSACGSSTPPSRTSAIWAKNTATMSCGRAARTSRSSWCRRQQSGGRPEPHPRASPARQRRPPDGQARAHPSPAPARQGRRHPGQLGAPAHASLRTAPPIYEVRPAIPLASGHGPPNSLTGHPGAERPNRLAAVSKTADLRGAERFTGPAAGASRRHFVSGCSPPWRIEPSAIVAVSVYSGRKRDPLRRESHRVGSMKVISAEV